MTGATPRRPNFALTAAAVALFLIVIAGCTGTPSAQTATETVTVTATAKVTATGKPEALQELDEVGQRRDAQHIVDILCRVATEYRKFDEITATLQANPYNLGTAQSQASEVVFAIEAMSALLAAGPADGWTDPWLALRAIQVAVSVDGSRTYFESATKSKSVDDLISMSIGVIDDPIDSVVLGDLPGSLPPKQANELLRCSAG